MPKTFRNIRRAVESIQRDILDDNEANDSDHDTEDDNDEYDYPPEEEDSEDEMFALTLSGGKDQTNKRIGRKGRLEAKLPYKYNKSKNAYDIVIDCLRRQASEEEINHWLDQLAVDVPEHKLRTKFLWSEMESGVDVFSLSALLNKSLVVQNLIKIFFYNVFKENPAGFLPYMRKKDSEGNTIISEMAGKGTTVETMEMMFSLWYNEEPIFTPNTVNNRGLHPIHFCFINTEDSAFPMKMIQFLALKVNQRILLTKDSKGNNILHYFFACYCKNHHQNLPNPSKDLKESLLFLLDLPSVKLCLLDLNQENETPEDVLRRLSLIHI